MRKLAALIICLAFAVFAQAQKAKIQTAWNYFNYKEFDKARVAIDEAAAHEQSSGIEKTWYYRALIYQAIAGDSKLKASVPDALDEAYKSYNKVLEINPKTEYKKEVEQGLQGIRALMFNEGLDAYNAKDFAGALAKFEWAAKLNPNDTTVLTNCAVSAQSAGNVPVAINYYEKLVEANVQDPRTYISLINLYKKNGMPEKASGLLKSAADKFPNDENLRVLKINEALEKGDVDNSINELNAAIAKDPTNAQLHEALGVMYDKRAISEKEKKSGKDQEYLQKAEASYKKAIELAPEHFDSNYNLGVLFFNQGAELINAANDLPPSKVKEYDSMVVKANSKFQLAKPYFEKAYKVKPDDFNLLNSLKQLYVRLGETEGDMYKNVVKALEKK